MLQTTIGAIIGAILSILTTITVENFRGPRLQLSIEAPPHDADYTNWNRPARFMRTIRLELHNAPLPFCMSWMTRAAALQCRGTITFHHLDGQNVFGRSMGVRWSNSPEPVPIPVLGPEGQHFQIIDLVRLTSESRMDVYPGEKQTLDVAVRMDDELDCYGWNNESYFCNPLWHNSNWKLGPGRYLISVAVDSSGRKCKDTFRIINDVPRADFRLEPATPEDKRRLSY